MAILLKLPLETDLNRYQVFRFRKKAEHLLVLNDTLYLNVREGLHKKVFYKTQVDIMALEVKRLLDTNHYGHNRMYELCKNYFFTIPRTAVRDVVASCDTCKTLQPLKQKEPFKHVKVTYCFEHIIIDLIDLKNYKTINLSFCWILNVIDVYSKFAKSYPSKSKVALEVSNALESLFLTFDPPTVLQCDNGKELTNFVINDLCGRFNVKLIHGRVRHPQPQGQIEGSNQTLTRAIAKQMDAKDENVKEACWIKYIDHVVYNYNIAVHSATCKSLFELFYRRKGFNTVLSTKNGGVIYSDLETDLFKEKKIIKKL